MKTEITKRVEFDAGHRIPSHASKCRNFHGHRYVLEATLEGDVNPVRGQSDDGMVLDFSAVKMIMTEHVHDLFDHAFIIYSGDTTGVQALKLLGSEHRTVIVDFVPTAENLASFIFEMLDFRFKSHYNRGQLRLTRVRLYETPTSWADVTRP